MNDIYDKNGKSNTRYIGLVKGVKGSNWVGAVKIGNKIYVGSGNNIGDRYYNYNDKTYDVDWSGDVLEPTPEQTKELNRSKDIYDKQ